MDVIDKISIIVPVYNVSLYLNECIDSIIHQTYPNIEIILVDDGSCDGSETICDEYSEKYKNIKVIHQKNGGVSVARNAGIVNVQGKYICFVDADDYIAPNLCEELVNNIDNNIDLVVSGFIEDYGQRKNKFGVSEVVNCTLQDLKRDFDYYYKIPLLNSPFAKLYKRDIIGDLRFDKDIAMGEDFHFNLKYYERCKNIRFIPVADYLYNVTNVNSATKKYKEGYFNCYIKCYEEGKKFKYGEIKFTNDALDETLCSNCLYFVQMIVYNVIDKKEMRSRVERVLGNSFFQTVCAGKYDFPLHLKIMQILAREKKYGLLNIYLALKKILSVVKR